MSDREFIPGYDGQIPCSSCVKKDVCELRKKNMMELQKWLTKDVEYIVFPENAKIILQCRYYYPEIFGSSCILSRKEKKIDRDKDENFKERIGLWKGQLGLFTQKDMKNGTVFLEKYIGLSAIFDLPNDRWIKESEIEWVQESVNDNCKFIKGGKENEKKIKP